MSSGSHDDVATTTLSEAATAPLVFRPTLRMQSWTFIIGSSLFALGSAPGLGKWLGTTGANTSFFIGAWFFTAAGFMQLLLSEPRIGPRGGVRAVWLAAAAQSFGTVLFNVSTGAALHTRQLSAERDFVWAPNAEGSLAFLISGGLLCFVLLRNKHYFEPRSRDWWSTWINAAGCVAFGISAVGSVLTTSGNVINPSWADTGTFVGALCFLAASAVWVVGRQPTVGNDA